MFVRVQGKIVMDEDVPLLDPNLVNQVSALSLSLFCFPLSISVNQKQLFRNGFITIF